MRSVMHTLSSLLMTLKNEAQADTQPADDYVLWLCTASLCLLNAFSKRCLAAQFSLQPFGNAILADENPTTI